MDLRYICLFSTVLLLQLAVTNGRDIYLLEILEKLGGLSSRIYNMEETLSGLVDTASKLESIYECGWPKLTGGHFEGNSSFYRGVLRALCDEGYTLKGNSLVECKADGIWTEIPKCVADCKPPTVHNSVAFVNPTYPTGSRVSVRCNFGYRRTGSRNLECVGDNEWSGITSCDPVDCRGPPAAEHGRYGPIYVTTFKSTLALECNDGFQLTGSDVIRCTGDGRWDGKQKCLERVCVDVDYVNGTNTTECVLKQLKKRYLNGDSLGKISTFDPAVCISYCFKEHGEFSYINLNSWNKCECVRRSGSEEYRYSSRYTYFRDREVFETIYMT